MNIFLLILISFFGFQAFAQETVHFNMHYKPETKYLGETSYLMEVKIINSGSDSFMSYFRDNGIDSISVVNELMKGKIELKVLNKDEQGRIPVEMKYVSLENNGVENNLVSGLTALGSIEGSNLPVLDSIKNSNFDSDFENEFLSMLNQMFEQIKFPNVTLAIGESFQDSNPVTLPIYGLEMEIDINTKYFLREIENNKAVFDIIQFGEISFKEGEKNYTGRFNGSGYSYYDTEHDILGESYMEITYGINYFSDYNNLKMLIKSEFQQKFEIQKL